MREGLSVVVFFFDFCFLLIMEDMGMGGMGYDMVGMDYSQMGGMDNSGEMMFMDGVDFLDSGIFFVFMDYSSMVGMDYFWMVGMLGM